MKSKSELQEYRMSSYVCDPAGDMERAEADAAVMQAAAEYVYDRVTETVAEYVEAVTSITDRATEILNEREESK